jgi:hypothetical protein
MSDDARCEPPGVGTVCAVSAAPRHTMSKPNLDRITLLAGLGVFGDAHLGAAVQHRSRVRRDPSQPNLRQVHLLHAELLDALCTAGFDVSAGMLGENVTTRGVDLLGLPTGTLLRMGASAQIEVTGLRNPCTQLDRLQPGLMQALVHRGTDGELVRLAGVMAIVLAGGEVGPGDPIVVELPPGRPRPLQPV